MDKYKHMNTIAYSQTYYFKHDMDSEDTLFPIENQANRGLRAILTEH